MRRNGPGRLDQVVTEDFDHILRHAGPEWLGREPDRLTRTLLRCESMDPYTALRFLDLFEAEPDLRAKLPRIPVPTLIARGRYDSVIPAKTAHLMHGLIPDARYVKIPDSGHFPSVTNPDEVNRLLRDFLAEQDRAGGGERT